jgi:putative ABC transport system permease protein
MPTTLLLTGLRDLTRRPLHTGLMLLGVALGVAVVVAMDLANASAQRAFALSARAVFGRATHQVVGGPSGVPDSLLRALRVARRARAVAPVVEASGVSQTLAGESVRLLGVDPLAEGPFRDALGSGALRSPAFGRLLTEPGACAVGSELARRHGLALGDELRVQVGSRQLALRVAALVETRSPDEAAGLDGLVLLDVGALQRLLGLGDRLTRIDLIASDRAARQIAQSLPPGLRLVSAGSAAQTAAQLTSAFELNLFALSLLALLVGTFLVYNTVTFAVVQRRALFGTLRSLGVSGRQILGMVLAETACAAALGSALGVALGDALGRAALAFVTRTINDLYYVVAVSHTSLGAPTLLKCVGLGLGAALVAALPPALEAARVEPAAALRPSELRAAAGRLLPRLALAGLLVGGAGALVLALATRRLSLAFAGLFGIVLGFCLCVPLLTTALLRLAEPVLGTLLGALGRIGARSIARSIERTGVAIAALMLAVSVTIGVGLMIESFRSTVVNWLDVTLSADLYVGVPGAGPRDTSTLPPDAVSRVAAVPGVASVESYRRVRVMSPNGELLLGVRDLRRSASRALYRFAAGSAHDPWRRVLAGAVLVSEPFAHRHRVAQGDSIRILTDRGERSFPVAGVFYDYSTEQGLVLMSRTVYEGCFDDRGVSSIGVEVAAGADPDAVEAALREALAGSGLRVTPNRRLKRAALAVFDRTFAVTGALRLLALLVALIGVWSALMALQLERTRELGTLVAIGLTPGQLTLLSLVETGLMGLAAGVLSLPLGALLAALLVDVINVRSFGWTMPLELGPRMFAEALVLAVAGALLASVYPLLRLRRLEVAAALRQE